VKAPAARTAKSGKPAASGVKARAPAASKTAAAKKKVAPAKPLAKAASKAKAPVKVAAAQPVAKKPAPKPAAKPVAKKAMPQPKAVAAKKPAAPVKTAKPAVKPVVKAPAKPNPPLAAKAAAPKVIPPTPKPAPAPVVVEPAPRPLGKRAAKKIMLEQMTQAAVVPTHAPDAAKATFFQMKNERAVMTPTVPPAIHKDPKRANNWKTLPVEQLTDQDVQAMPDSEYMNDLQLAFFRRKLAQLKADMLANAGETTEHLREDTVVVPDPADRATIEEEHALELRTRDRERKLLKKIEQAIARIDSGDYGYCEETGEPIGVGRLMARPTASLSLEAQQRRELKQKMFGD